MFLKINFNSFHLCLGLLSGLLPSGFSTRIFCVFIYPCVLHDRPISSPFYCVHKFAANNTHALVTKYVYFTITIRLTVESGPNVTVEWLVCLILIPRLPGLNLGSDSGCYDWKLSWLPAVRAGTSKLSDTIAIHCRIMKIWALIDLNFRHIFTTNIVLMYSIQQRYGHSAVCS
jgi:hypothetical protein